ncbi:tRNA-dihydrouridine(20a/20b) synthase [NAD(P)+]-like protein [Apophysomyces sp. BC1034]|nr:tRNA-dihydrouridine(20a/20b) synthase [NAD(P)+]-like protein [Apophysomyces sp. BC1015]KAG0169110.1 tRNA-dihydrouridine(20a/20b) synthase [NAD(P)+]-like protein [Apophysomyces sp. BC1021]KAG0184296.1 tRNA-dihydrouridine(20a/20b) synthase [NAD(P)+]-like protein [Apophysomyces sp. BC1034]
MKKKTTALEVLEAKSKVNVCAPMVRYSKLPFRELVLKYNVDLAYTPMILADVFKNSEFARECDFTTNVRDDPVVVQFAASNGVDLAAAAELVAPYVGGIDINCGCPQRWAVQEKIGAHLMSDPETVRDMIRTVKARVDIPCSIKIRVHPDLKKTYEFVKRAESVGVDFLTVHGRTRHQKSTEAVNFEGIKLVKESVGMPVIANGSIFSMKDVDEMYEKTGVDGVMSARGLLQNPALFAGYESTPWECIEDYVRLALGYGTNTFIFHHHLMFMFEDVMSNAERKTFNTLSSIPAILDHLETHWGLDVSRLI